MKKPKNFENKKTWFKTGMCNKFVCIMTVPYNGRTLLELYYSCFIPILSNDNISSLVFLSLAVGQIEPTWVQNIPLRL
jgi:hypothetical protein